MKTGLVKWFDEGRGIGFLATHGMIPPEGDIYVHVSGIASKAISLKAGDEVSFDTTVTARGPRAVDVRVLRRVPAPLKLVPRAYYPSRD